MADQKNPIKKLIDSLDEAAECEEYPEFAALGRLMRGIIQEAIDDEKLPPADDEESEQ